MATPNLVLPGHAPRAANRKPNSRSFAVLIDKLNAAVADVNKWAPREERLSDEFCKAAGPKPKVKGGVTRASKLIREGEPDLAMSASDWFFPTRDSIEEGRAKELAEADTPDSRDAIEERFAGLLADWDAQEAARDAHKPRGLDHAKRMLSKAHKAWTEAEDEIVNYRPRTIEELTELLAFAGRDGMRGVHFTPDEGQLKFMMRTAAEVLGEHFPSAG